ncbi:Mov34/MPN/PAD-1 family protein [Herbidospora mongoliensis]|uniref:Mov34/MPN/PAD-1 family protein n=1 Tax=Herbidospora mongoliensis TaxID=688067 RepID=UPI0008311833|nr:Mov34/MPN/PAD-1 family protein [Herbidospora mongoliensis]
MAGDGNDFEIVGRRFDAPFRPRADYSGHLRFTVDPGLSVYVAPDVAASLRRLAREAAPLETGGLLAGRTFRDDHGSYLLVTAMAVAPPVAGGHSTFHLTPEGTERLRRELARRDPTADVTGWWHSHHVPSSYSSVDRANQSMWTNPTHIGLLVFAKGSPWARVYVGPDSRGEIDSDPADVREGPAPKTQRAVEQRPVARLAPPPAPKRFRPLLALAAALGVLILVVELLHLLAILRSGEPRSDVAWRCVVQSSATAATCSADLGALSRPEWFLGDYLIGTTRDITFVLPAGAHTVRLRARGERGEYDIGQTVLIGR